MHLLQCMIRSIADGGQEDDIWELQAQGVHYALPTKRAVIQLRTTSAGEDMAQWTGIQNGAGAVGNSLEVLQRANHRIII